MQVTRTDISETKVKLTIEADMEQLEKAKNLTLRTVAKDLRLPGFRAGKAPLTLVEKNSNPNVLQQDFLDRAMNAMYGLALDQQKLRPVAQPKVTVTKFVPFTTLVIEAVVDVIGTIKLSDYKQTKLAKATVVVADDEIDEVVQQLRTREATRNDVNRAAQTGDQVIINFAGTDSKTKEPIGGADGKEYPFVLGSNNFITGFEPNIIGMEAGAVKLFSITFPDDYNVSALQGREVNFEVTVQKVQEIVELAADDDFAAKIGPFKTLDELKADIKKQLVAEKQQQADRAFEEQLLNKIADESEVAVPEALVEAEVDRMEADERQTLGYRGQTWQEHLEAESTTEIEHRERNKEQAIRRVKAGLVLADIAEKENVDVSKQELDLRLQLLRGQYQDKAMQTELTKAENQREIASRMLTEKTIAQLVKYATAA